MSRYRYLSLIVCTVGMSVLLGCGPTDLSEVDLPIPVEHESDSPKEKEKRTQTVKVATTEVENSPAKDILSPPASDASPESVCRHFVRELNRENSDQFRLLLTSAAINVSSKLNFDLPPIADADTHFELSEPRYASIRKNICYIDCSIESADEPNDTGPQKISWMMRKTNSGWRVAGMLVPSKEQSSNLLSFENVVDIKQIQDSLTEEVSTSAAAAD